MKRKTLSLLVLVLVIVSFLFLLKKAEYRHQEQLITALTEVTTGEIRKGESLYLALIREGIPKDKIVLLEKTLRPVLDVKKSQIGDRYELARDIEGKFQSFKYYTSIDPITFYLVEAGVSGRLVAKEEKLPVEKKIARAEGTIKSSLYEAMLAAGQHPGLAMEFSDIFEWEIDFLTDPRPGDRFRLVWEQYVDDGKVVLDGRVLIAQYINGQRTHTAIYFEDPAGNRSYFTKEGKSLRKEFLKSPLSYRRISSYFSHRRFHPILKTYRPHLGIDYAAPVGTPVRTIGAGRVVYCGWKGGFGRFIKIKHSRGYYTTYGHLSRYARGMRVGVKVHQGQLIGYVGSSGLSTGPHLDFRVIKNGKYINFLKLKLPSVKAVEKKYLEDFHKVKEIRLQQLEGIS
jgi:murein DD-endopeptidase MepM/ murein hydrolase activator NlpD